MRLPRSQADNLGHKDGAQMVDGTMVVMFRFWSIGGKVPMADDKARHSEMAYNAMCGERTVNEILASGRTMLFDPFRCTVGCSYTYINCAVACGKRSRVRVARRSGRDSKYILGIDRTAAEDASANGRGSARL